MKHIYILIGLFFLAGHSGAQVQVDKPIELTGTGLNAKITGIDDVSLPSDATSARVVQQGSLNYASVSGTADAIALSLAPAPSAYSAGMIVNFKVQSPNTGPVTLDVNGLGPVTIKKSVINDLGSGDFQIGQMVSVIHDGTHFQWLHGSSSSGGGLPPGSCFSSNDPVSPPGYSLGGQTQVHSSGWSARTAGPYLGGFGSFGRAMAVWNNKLYLFGGDTYGTNDQTHVYDPALDTWTTLAPMTGRGRGNIAAATVGNKIYVFGGQHPSLNTVSWVDEYDPINDTWATKADMPTNRRYLSAAAVNNKIYVFGGGNYSAVDVVEEYNPATNSWATKTPMPSAREYVTAIVYNNLIYVIGGSTGSAQLNESLTYDPATDSWDSLNNAPVASYFSGSVIGSKIYLCSGTQNWEYNPATDAYVLKSPPLNSVNYFTPAASVGGKMYVMDTNYNQVFDPVSDKTIYTHCPE